MVRKVITGLVAVITILFSLSAMAISVTTPQIVLSPTPISLTQNADASEFGQLLGNATTANVTTVFSCTSIFSPCTSANVKLDSSIQPSGITATVNGITYGVYNTGVPGIGFIIGVKDTNATKFIPLTDKEQVTWSGSVSNIGFTAQAYFIKTDSRLVTGTITTPTITAAVMTGFEKSTGWSATSKIVINPTTITVTVQGCDVDQSVLNFSMGEVSESVFNGVGSGSERVSAATYLTCAANVTVAMVVTDQTDQTNTSNTVKLTSDSQAKGIGVQFFAGDAAVQPFNLGPDSSLKGTTNQIKLLTSDTDNFKIEIPLTARYVQTGEITVGSANALASITFSYQ
ncbi:TPA: fimbrial protein [Serratia fonticola]